MSAEQFKQALQDMDVTPAELAKETGLSRSVLTRILAGNPPSQQTQLKIEAALDRPIWSSQETFDANRKRRKLFRKEPAGMSIEQLRVLAKSCGIKYAKEQLYSREKLIERIMPILEARAAKAQAAPPSPEQIELAQHRFNAIMACNEWRCKKCSAVFTVKPGTMPKTCRKCRSLRIELNIDLALLKLRPS